MENMSRKWELLEEIRQKRKELDHLYEALPRSLRIQELWPEAFENGCKCSPVLIGTNWPNGSKIPPFVTKYPEPYHRVREIKRTFLRRSDGIEKEISPDEFFSIYAGSVDYPDILRRSLRGELPVGEKQ